MKIKDIWFCLSISWFMTRWLGGVALGVTVALIGLSYFQEPSINHKIIGETLWIIGILFSFIAGFTLVFTKEGIKELKKLISDIPDAFNAVSSDIKKLDSITI